MKKSNVETAIAEAKRFLKRAKAANAELETDISWGKGELNAACKRASLDLTKALAKMRRDT